MLSLFSRPVMRAAAPILSRGLSMHMGNMAGGPMLPTFTKLLFGASIYAALSVGIAATAEKKHYGHLFRQLGQM